MYISLRKMDQAQKLSAFAGEEISAWYKPLLASGEWYGLKRQIDRSHGSIGELESTLHDINNSVAASGAISATFDYINAWWAMLNLPINMGAPIFGRMQAQLQVVLSSEDCLKQLATLANNNILSALYELPDEMELLECTWHVGKLLACADAMRSALAPDAANGKLTGTQSSFFVALCRLQGASPAQAWPAEDGGAFMCPLPSCLVVFLQVLAAATGSAQQLQAALQLLATQNEPKKDVCRLLSSPDDLTCWCVAALAGNAQLLQAIPPGETEEQQGLLLAACCTPHARCAQLVYEWCVSRSGAAVQEWLPGAAAVAAHSGSAPGMALALQHSHVDLQQQRTLLQVAVQQKHPGIVRMLLPLHPVQSGDLHHLLVDAASAGDEETSGVLLQLWLAAEPDASMEAWEQVLGAAFGGGIATARTIVDCGEPVWEGLTGSGQAEAMLHPALLGGWQEATQLALLLMSADAAGTFALDALSFSAAVAGGNPACLQTLLRAADPRMPPLAAVGPQRMHAMLEAAAKQGNSDMLHKLLFGLNTVDSSETVAAALEGRGALLMAAVQSGSLACVQHILRADHQLGGGAASMQVLQAAVQKRYSSVHVLHALLHSPGTAGLMASSSLETDALTTAADAWRYDILEELTGAPAHHLHIASVAAHCLQVGLRRAPVGRVRQKQQLRFLQCMLQPQRHSQVDIGAVRQAVRLLASKVPLYESLQDAAPRLSLLLYLLAAGGGPWRQHLQDNPQGLLGVQLPSRVQADGSASVLCADAVDSLQQWEPIAGLPQLCRLLCVAAAAGWAEGHHVHTSADIVSGAAALQQLGPVRQAVADAGWARSRGAILARAARRRAAAAAAVL